MKISKGHVEKAVAKVLDPELNISIADLGLIYSIQTTDKGNVKIIMTLTTIGCPLYPMIEQQVKDELKKIGVSEDKINIELTFDPPWSMKKMSKKAKTMLGI